MIRLLSFFLLLLALPAFAIDADEQHRAGAEVVELAADRVGYTLQMKDAVRSLARGRTADARRWAVCWCFEADQGELGPEHGPGCHWLAAYSLEADLSEAERRTVTFCAGRP